MPSPGKHSPKYPAEAPSWSFGNAPNEAKRNKEDALANLGPGTHEPEYNDGLDKEKGPAPIKGKAAAFSKTSKSGKGPAVWEDNEKNTAIRTV